MRQFSDILEWVGLGFDSYPFEDLFVRMVLLLLLPANSLWSRDRRDPVNPKTLPHSKERRCTAWVCRMCLLMNVCAHHESTQTIKTTLNRHDFAHAKWRCVFARTGEKLNDISRSACSGLRVERAGKVVERGRLNTSHRCVHHYYGTALQNKVHSDGNFCRQRARIQGHVGTMHWRQTHIISIRTNSICICR